MRYTAVESPISERDISNGHLIKVSERWGKIQKGNWGLSI